VLISHIRKRGSKERSKDPSIADLYGSSNIWKEATTVLLLTKMRAADTHVVWLELPDDELDKRYMGTKIILAKSRMWLPKLAFGLIYDLQSKKYLDKFQWLLEDESWIKEDEKLPIMDLDSIEI
jgi:hypothetical protein